MPPLIPVPASTTAAAQDLCNTSRRLSVTLDRFTTEAKLDEAEALAAEASAQGKALRIHVRQIRADHKRRQREAAQEAARAEAENARILAAREDVA